jgi:hypothetical protein
MIFLILFVDKFQFPVFGIFGFEIVDNWIKKNYFLDSGIVIDISIMMLEFINFFFLVKNHFGARIA